MLGEDVEDERRAVEDLHPVPKRAFQFSLLTGGEFFVENHYTGAQFSLEPTQFFNLPLTDEGGGIGA